MATAVTDGTILVAEDEPEVRSYLELALRSQGFRVQCASDGEELLNYVGAPDQRIDLVLLDIVMPRKDGMDTLREIRRLDKKLPVIMISGISAPFRIVDAMKSGATDFLAKPISHEDLENAIRKALNGKPSPGAAAWVDSLMPGESFIPGSDRMKKIERALRQIGASDAPVLLQGESGVGKEVLALQLHAMSPRASKLFLKINCVALPSELLESELFGYEKGAFTGAFKNKPGKFELADGGTVMLDEVGDMDFRLQAKMLHVLQDHEFQRLGGKETVRVNVRVMAATHCDLEEAIREGRFREDLFYRLNVINIYVPPLRERKDEILPLASSFLRKHAPAGATLPVITPVLKQALLAHNWPGNIRELENIMRKFLVFRDPDLLAEELLFKTRRKAVEMRTSSPEQVSHQTETPESGAAVRRLEIEERPVCEPPLAQPARGSGDPAFVGENEQKQPSGDGSRIERMQTMSAGDESPAGRFEKAHQVRRRLESEAILAALHSTHWNRKRAAEILQMDYKALLYKMKKLDIESRAASFTPPTQTTRAAPDSGSILRKVNESYKQAEIDAILTALTSTRWNRKRAAKLLNLDYKALLYKMKKLGIETEAAPAA